MCRDILNSCVRNTEEAEKNSYTTNSDGSSGRGQGKGVWGMIEESELAKSIRKDDQKKVDDPIATSPVRSRNPSDVPSAEQQSQAEILSRVRSCKTQLEDVLARSPSSSSSPVSPIQYGNSELLDIAKDLQKSLVVMIETITEPARLQELLTVNDDLTALLTRCAPQKPSLTLHGLGIRIENGKVNGDAEAEPVANGHTVDNHESEVVATDFDDEEPATPRVDKGKGRARAEPEKPEKVLSPTFLITESDDEDGDGQHPLAAQHSAETVISPTDRWVLATISSLLFIFAMLITCRRNMNLRSRSWVAEEGEVFRKGTVLLGPEEMEGEYDGEELRREVSRSLAQYRVQVLLMLYA